MLRNIRHRSIVRQHPKENFRHLYLLAMSFKCCRHAERICRESAVTNQYNRKRAILLLYNRSINNIFILSKCHCGQKCGQMFWLFLLCYQKQRPMKLYSLYHPSASWLAHINLYLVYICVKDVSDKIGCFLLFIFI